MKHQMFIVTSGVGTLLIENAANATPHAVEPNYSWSQVAMWDGNNNNVMDGAYFARSGRNS